MKFLKKAVQPRPRMNRQERTAELVDYALGRNMLGSHLQHKYRGPSSAWARNRGQSPARVRLGKGFIVNNNSMVNLLRIPNLSQF